MAEVARKKKKLNKQQWKYILSIGLLVLTTVLTAYTLLSQGNFSEIVTTLNNAKTGYVALIVAITAVCWLIEGLVLMLSLAFTNPSSNALWKYFFAFPRSLSVPSP